MLYSGLLNSKMLGLSISEYFWSENGFSDGLVDGHFAVIQPTWAIGRKGCAPKKELSENPRLKLPIHRTERVAYLLAIRQCPLLAVCNGHWMAMCFVDLNERFHQMYSIQIFQ